MQPPDPSGPGGPEPVPPSSPFIPPPAPGVPPPDPSAAIPPPPPPVPPPTPGVTDPLKASAPPPSGSSSDDRLLALIAHIGGAFTCFLAPLVVWLVKKEQGGFVEDQAKEALNFQITVAICIVGLLVLSVVPVVGCLTAILLPVVGITSLVLAIVAGVKANDGQAYRYPFALRLVK